MMVVVVVMGEGPDDWVDGITSGGGDGHSGCRGGTNTAVMVVMATLGVTNFCLPRLFCKGSGVGNLFVVLSQHAVCPVEPTTGF